MARPVSGPWSVAPTNATSQADVAAIKTVIEAAKAGREAGVLAAQRSITDPVARKLAEWVYLRSDNTKPPFARYAAFITENPAWPHVPMFRRRAENALWNDKLDDNTVRNFFANRAKSQNRGSKMSQAKAQNPLNQFCHMSPLYLPICGILLTF